MDGAITNTRIHTETAKYSFVGSAFCKHCMERTEHSIEKTRFGYQAKCHQCGKGGRGKFNNAKSEYNGRWYDSQAEAFYAGELDIKLKAKLIRSWEPQKRFEFVVNGRPITTHKVDFEIVNNDGTIELHEVKGKENEDWRIRRNLLLATIVDPDPNISYHVIKV